MNEKITKPANVIMLHSDKPSVLVQVNKNVLAFSSSIYPEQLEGFILQGSKYQHLYFTTDEEIKEGDWYYSPDLKMIFQAVAFPLSLRTTAKKIIATTNPELWGDPKGTMGGYIAYINGVPKIDTSFVEAYVREQGKINKVLLEYEHPSKGSFAGIERYDSMVEILKLKPNGSVVVHPIKEKTYTRDEVMHIADEWRFHYGNKVSTSGLVESVKAWFDKNYPPAVCKS